MKLLAMIIMYIMAIHDKSHNPEEVRNRLAELPWIILPSALDNYFPNDSVTRFKNGNWIEYPEYGMLTQITESNVKKIIRSNFGTQNISDNKINFEKFDVYNYSNKHFLTLKTALIMEEAFSNVVLTPSNVRYLAMKVAQKTGIQINKAWLEQFVLNSLDNYYSEELSSKMREQFEMMISEFSNAEIESSCIELDEVFARIYVEILEKM